MPPGMPGYVGKGEIFKRLDDLLADNAKRATFLNRIKKKTNGEWDEDFVDVLAAMLPLSAKEKKHIEEDWFGEYETWWPRQQPAEIICRLGMIQAIGLATGNRKMDTYWVCGVNDFQFVSLVSSSQVTVLVFTPNAPVSDQMPEDYENSTEVDPIFTVRHRSRGPGENQVQPDEEFCEFVQPRIPKHG